MPLGAHGPSTAERGTTRFLFLLLHGTNRRGGRHELLEVSRRPRGHVVTEVEPQGDLVLRKRVHLLPRQPVGVGVLRVSKELQLDLKLERFPAIVEEEATDTDHVELLVGGWSAVGCGRGAVATGLLRQLPLTVVGILSAPLVRKAFRDARHRALTKSIGVSEHFAWQVLAGKELSPGSRFYRGDLFWEGGIPYSSQIEKLF